MNFSTVVITFIGLCIVYCTMMFLVKLVFSGIDFMKNKSIKKENKKCINDIINDHIISSNSILMKMINNLTEEEIEYDFEMTKRDFIDKVKSDAKYICENYIFEDLIDEIEPLKFLQYMPESNFDLYNRISEFFYVLNIPFIELALSSCENNYNFINDMCLQNPLRDMPNSYNYRVNAQYVNLNEQVILYSKNGKEKRLPLYIIRNNLFIRIWSIISSNHISICDRAYYENVNLYEKDDNSNIIEFGKFINIIPNPENKRIYPLNYCDFHIDSLGNVQCFSFIFEPEKVQNICVPDYIFLIKEDGEESYHTINIDTMDDIQIYFINKIKYSMYIVDDILGINKILLKMEMGK